ncbi:MAG: methyltransferase domain-containing protein [Bifidobacteriaceae bacterium]|nr:methyltransferase domain-containing protein [Bifidobacteriaceae bacterium]
MEPNNFELENTTIWNFKNRGKWATHDSKWRGNWSPYIPRNILLRYSNEGDTVLDQFVGGGTSLIEAKLLNRNCIGIDINSDAIKWSKEKIKFNTVSNSQIKIRQGDAKNLKFLKNETIDLIITHPPYANIIEYSDNLKNDLSLLPIKEFLIDIEKVASESFRVLKQDKYCAILIGDTRKKGMVQPLGMQVMQKFLDAGFTLKEIIIKEQHNCKATGFWKTNSKKYNFLLLAHEYLFIFYKDDKV